MSSSRRNVGAILVGALILVGCSGGGDPGADGSSGAGDDAPTSADERDAAGDDAADASGDSDGDSDGPSEPAEPLGRVDHGPLTTPIPAVEPVAVYTIDDDDEVEESAELMLPSDLLEVVQRGVEAGSFSEAEGIARALDGLSGRGTPTPGLGLDDAIEPGLTGLTRRGTDLLESDDLDERDRTLLADALRVFNPSQELLDAISIPAPGPTAGFANASFSRSPGAPAAPIEIVRQDCFDVIATGVSTDADLDTGEECFHYVEEFVDGHQLRVYYSSTWQTDPDQLALVDVALDGLVTSVGVYGDLATVGPINAVFSLADNGTALAQQTEVAPGATCPITLFPSASAGSMDVFRQTVAHEVFHCVQDWSFTTAGYDTHKWWLEGSAEYFSNVVYPTVNDEHGRTWQFDANSLDHDITQMSYENTVFFQFHANVRGDAATIDLLRTVSAAGATVDAIGSMPGMDQLWRDFVVAGVADAIHDTGGGTVGRFERFKPMIAVERVQTVDLPTSPMQAPRYPVRYVKGKRYEQTIAESAHLAAAWANEARDLSAWTEMPVEVRPTCERNRTYVVVATSVDEPLTPKADVGTAEQAVCDPCLLGTWGLQLGTFADYIKNVIESGGESVDGVSIVMDGAYTFVIAADGAMSAEKDFTMVFSLDGVGASPPTRITGTESGRYDADGERLSVTDWQGETTASLSGVSSSVFSDEQGAPTGYTCEDGVLTLTTLPYGPLVFDLLDGPPEPPPIIVETGG
jgi:hypothetical protein